MFNKLIMNCKKINLIAKKNSPEILMSLGVAGIVGSTVLACYATLKANSVVIESKEVIDKLEENTDDYKSIKNKELAKVGLKIAQYYGPSIVLGTISIGMVIKSNRILRKRNILLASSYAVLNNEFKDYRKRVADKYGKDEEKKIRYNIQDNIDVKMDITSENGTEVVVNGKVSGYWKDKLNLSEFARIFDSNCDGYSRDYEYNMIYLQQKQNYLTDKLKVQGFLFLNDVYDELGFKKTKKGQMMGWIYDEKNPIGDNYVDFGLYGTNSIDEDDGTYEPVIILDFNIDGNILENF